MVTARCSPVPVSLQKPSRDVSDVRPEPFLLGNKKRRKGGSITQRWLYLDGLVPVAEVDGSNAVVSRFVFGSGNSPEYMIRGGATYRFVCDLPVRQR